MKRRNFLGLGALALAAVPGVATLLGREHPVAKALVMRDNALESVPVNDITWDEPRIFGLMRTHWYTRAEIEAMYGPSTLAKFELDPELYGLTIMDIGEKA